MVNWSKSVIHFRFFINLSKISFKLWWCSDIKRTDAKLIKYCFLKERKQENTANADSVGVKRTSENCLRENQLIYGAKYNFSRRYFPHN